MSLEEFQEAIEEEINALQFKEPRELYDPIQYLMRQRGKRLRPMLCLISYNLFAEDWRNILKPALGIEIFHNFTLMHDDIMDKAPLRRGQKTIHEKWNSNIAILSGDVMLVKAYECFNTVENKYLHDVLTSFSECATQVCEGQQMDMNFELMPEVTESEYLAMIHKKTAALLGLSMKLGGLLSNQDAETLENLYDYGTNLGMAFQLRDDLLDVYGDEDFGKQTGGDIISGKKTFLLIKAFDKASKSDKDIIRHWLELEVSENERKVKEIITVYENLSIKQETEEKINEYYLKAVDKIGNLQVQEEKFELLTRYTESLKTRLK